MKPMTGPGPIPISPDGEPIMGLAPERDNFYLACGFTSGIAASGGAGKAMAEWITEGEPGLDLWAFDVRRFGSHHMSARYLAERSVDSYWRYYQIHYPIEELTSARGGRRSPPACGRTYCCTCSAAALMFTS